MGEGGTFVIGPELRFDIGSISEKISNSPTEGINLYIYIYILPWKSKAAPPPFSIQSCSLVPSSIVEPNWTVYRSIPGITEVVMQRGCIDLIHLQEWMYLTNLWLPGIMARCSYLFRTNFALFLTTRLRMQLKVEEEELLKELFPRDCYFLQVARRESDRPRV